VDVARLERAAEVVFFTPNTLVGLAFLLLSFLLELEAYGLRMAHLSPHFVMTVAIFGHLCEMFVCICPSLMLFR
jgi:hypothetical protein